MTTLLLMVGVLVVPSSVLAQPSAGSHLPPDKNRCARCHFKESKWKGDRLRLFVSAETMTEDVHTLNGVNCHDCHGGDPSSLNVRKVHAAMKDVKKSCSECHADQMREMAAGVHADVQIKDAGGREVPMDCGRCHGEKAHGMLPVRDPRSRVVLEQQVRLCGDCHTDAADEYMRSAHAHGLEQLSAQSGTRAEVTAVCADCHGAHAIHPATDGRSILYATRVAATCGKCHDSVQEQLRQSVHGKGVGPGSATKKVAPGGNVKRKPTCTNCHEGHDVPATESLAFRLGLPHRCGQCHGTFLEDYRMSLHGALTELGYGPAAKCSDCHGAHDVLPLSNPRSRLAAGVNRLETCKKCHPAAVPNFVSFHPHADHRDAQAFPVLHAVYVAMEVLIYAVFGFFGVHNLLWLVRSLIHVLRHGRPERLRAGIPAYVRFAAIHRIEHAVIVVTFLGLALTGLPLKYSHQQWAQRLAGGLGGFGVTSSVHRVCAIVMIVFFTAHVLQMIRKIPGGWRRSGSLKAVCFGPDSPIPNLRDFTDALGMFRWFFGLGRKPVFERWTYWEKFDYWAVFWGLAIIGTSGLILWFPNLFSRVLPGEALNVAKLIHSEEALLATGFIFAVHFFSTHFRPEKFPMDLSVLSGLASENELRDERPEFFERMQEQGDLDALQTTVPSRPVLLLLALGGFLALAVGLSLLIGILLAVFG